MTKQWRYQSGDESSPWPLRAMWLALLVLPLMALLSYWGVNAYSGPSPEAASPHQSTQGEGIAPLIEQAGQDWDDYRREQRALLNSTAWRDAERRVARVPLKEAMSAFLREQTAKAQSGEGP